MNRPSLRIVLGFALLLSTWSPAADQVGVAAGAAPVAESDAAAQAKLDHNLPDVDFNSNQFVDVIDFLRDVTGANIFVNWHVLEAAGFAKSTTVTVRLKNVAFKTALATILEAADGEKTKLAYVINQGVITISTVEDLRKNTSTEAYDVRDLLGDKPKAGQTARAPEDRQERIDAMVKLVTGTVDPESWSDNGGRVGEIKELSGQLIVTQTPQNHKAIENLITQTRKLFVPKAKDK